MHGVALWKTGTHVVRAGTLQILAEVREQWDRQQNRDRFNDILETEAIGPLILLMNFPELFREAQWLHFTDNVAALSSLTNGSSSVLHCDILVGAT